MPLSLDDGVFGHGGQWDKHWIKISRFFVNLNMSHAELQRRDRLIAFIQKVQDQNVIDEIYRLLRIGFDDSVLTTTPDQKRAIAAAQREIAEGKGIPEEDADREIDEWLGK